MMAVRSSNIIAKTVIFKTVPIVRSRNGETVNNRLDFETLFFIGVHLVGLFSVKHLFLFNNQLARAALTFQK